MAIDLFIYQMIVMMVSSKGGDGDEDGSVVDPGSNANQAAVGCLAEGGDHSQRVDAAPVGGTFQTGSGDGPERTVSDGASREKRSRLAIEERFDRQDGMACAALS
jgi:hypothetical protein